MPTDQQIATAYQPLKDALNPLTKHSPIKNWVDNLDWNDFDAIILASNKVTENLQSLRAKEYIDNELGKPFKPYKPA